MCLWTKVLFVLQYSKISLFWENISDTVINILLKKNLTLQKVEIIFQVFHPSQFYLSFSAFVLDYTLDNT